MDQDALVDVFQRIYANGEKPEFIRVSPYAMAAFKAELVASDWQDRGFNWRRVKRERRKALKVELHRQRRR